MDWIENKLTRDFLRPALIAAGFDAEVAEQYEVTWVCREDSRPPYPQSLPPEDQQQ